MEGLFRGVPDPIGVIVTKPELVPTALGDAATDGLRVDVVDPLTEGEPVTQALALTLTEFVSRGDMELQKLFAPLIDPRTLSVIDPVLVLVTAVDREPHPLTVLVRLLVVLALAHAETFVVGDPFELIEPDPETAFVFELVIEAVDVWLAELVTDAEPLAETVVDALWAELLLADTEALIEIVPLAEPDTDSLALSL